MPSAYQLTETEAFKVFMATGEWGGDGRFSHHQDDLCLLQGRQREGQKFLLIIDHDNCQIIASSERTVHITGLIRELAAREGLNLQWVYCIDLDEYPHNWRHLEEPHAWKNAGPINDTYLLTAKPRNQVKQVAKPEPDIYLRGKTYTLSTFLNDLPF